MMNSADSTPGLLAWWRDSRFWRSSGVAVALLSVVGLAEARDVSPAPEPVVIEYESGSDCLFWDLCLDDGASHASGELARAVIEQMTDPAALYVVRAPELPAAWEAPPAGLLRDADGERIERRQLSLNRRHYEAMVERALIGVLDQVRSERPEAAVSIEGYRTLSIRNGRRQVYSGLESELSFLSFPDGSKATDARSLDRWLDRQGVGDAGTALVETGDGWVLVGGGELLEALEAPLEAEYVDAWPAGEGSAAESMAGPAQRELGESMSEGQNHSVTDTGLAMLPHLRSAADGIESPRDPDSGEGDGQGGPDAGPGDGGEEDPADENPNEPGEGEDGPTLRRVIQPGDGFGPVVEPDTPAGSGPGRDAQAIARWDVVPFQTIDEPFKVGVVAFHMNGIERVDFYLNGGLPTEVYQAELNDRTQVEEYWATIDPSLLPDGMFEVRAVVWPELGEPRVLAGEINQDTIVDGEHSIMMTANAGGSLETPVVTVGPGGDVGEAIASIAEGGEVHLLPGDYDISNMRHPREMTRWVTVRPAPGATRDQVRIRPPAGERRYMRIKGELIRWQDLTFDLARIQRIVPHPRTTSHDGDSHWFDSCVWTDTNGWDYTYEENIPTPYNGSGTWYSTDSVYHDTRFGPMRHQLVRNADISQISGEVLEGTRIAVNCNIDNVDGTILENSIHTDIVQWHNANTRRIANQILYGVHGSDLFSQHFFLRTGGGAMYEDIAFVDVSFKTRDDINPATGRPLREHTRSQLWCDHEHVIFRNVKTDIPLHLRTEETVGNPAEAYTAKNVLFENCGLAKKTVNKLNELEISGVRINGIYEWDWWED